MGAAATWCRGNEDRLLGRATACQIDTFEGACVLLAAGVVVVWYCHFLKRVRSRGAVPMSPRLRWFYTALLSTLVASHALLLAVPRITDGSWIVHRPSQAFFGASALVYHTLLLLMTLVAPAAPVPRNVVAFGGLFCVLFASQVAVLLHGSSSQASLVLCCLQLLLALILAITTHLRDPVVLAPLTSEQQALLAVADLEAGWRGKRKPTGSWIALLRDAVQYVWPTDPWLRLRALACVVLIVIMRALNLTVPILYKRMVDTLADITAQTHSHDHPAHFTFAQAFFPHVLLYLGAWILQGGGGMGSVGLVPNARTYLWIPVSQDAERRISLRAFSHLLNLDLTFHLNRKTGEVLKILDRGNSSMKSLLSTVLFDIAPAILDVLGATAYLSNVEPWMACIVLASVCVYVPTTIYITEFRLDLRREMNKMDNKRNAKVTDALLNYETVKYFVNEKLEADGYEAAIVSYQLSEFRKSVSLVSLNFIQMIIMFTGISSGMVVCIGRVAAGELTVGDAVLFITLMAQIFAPLNYFGSYYRVIQKNMIDMENMADLLATQPGVQDAPGAAQLRLSKGALEFRNVCFGYKPDALVLKNVSFNVGGGRTLALVGSTGAGKSTVLRLLFRFYDPTSGAILLDGTDIRSVTQLSLRRCIAVVPQDTVLFNESVEYNIAYGRTGASREEIVAAAEAASLHESVVSRFPQHYATVVGERGLRLSGGEKQRVAFARAILKNCCLLVLDEATSSLDSITERQIQDCLREQRALRTTVIVAHRLSTVMDADVIVVLEDGRIVEHGGHAELLRARGRYADMWMRQQAVMAAGAEGAAAFAEDAVTGSEGAAIVAEEGAATLPAAAAIDEADGVAADGGVPAVGIGATAESSALGKNGGSGADLGALSKE